MISRIVIIFSILILSEDYSICQNVEFNQYFTGNTMRVDFYLSGNKNNQQLAWYQIKEGNSWAGNKKYLIDTTQYGNYYFTVESIKDNSLLYSRGFSTLYQEWQTTKEADILNRSFEQTILFPYPKNSIKLKIYYRNRDNDFLLLATRNIDPFNYFIKQEFIKGVNYFNHLNSGKPDEKVDIVFLAEGYTSLEMNKFKQDVEKYSNALFSTSPYDKYQDYFNLWGIESISEESGPDIPKENIWSSTVFNSSFYTFNSERYLSSQSVFKMHDYASLVPYDIIVILVNTEKYGGGGIYNHYTLFSSDNSLSSFLFVHELGHGFIGLADEYVGTVAYSDFYNIEVEPWEPNITTLIEFNMKWNSMISGNTPVPTPVKKIYKDIVGVYEGAGYNRKGIYRPYIDCMMNTKSAEEFCPVCKQAIENMIKKYCK